VGLTAKQIRNILIAAFLLLSPVLTGYDYVIASGYRLLAHRTYPAISTQCQN